MKGSAFVLVLAMTLLAMPARAIDREDDPPPGVQAGNILSTGSSSPSEAQLIAQAQQMPAVLQAMYELATMGLTHDTSNDRAAYNGDTTVVALAYHSQSNPDEFGTVMVYSTNTSGTWTTKVFGGPYLYDATTSAFTEAPITDGTVEVMIGDMTTIDSSNYSTERSAAHKFLDYGLCVLGEGLALGRVGALCGPYAPACATVGVIFATIHCGFHISDN